MRTNAFFRVLLFVLVSLSHACSVQEHLTPLEQLQISQMWNITDVNQALSLLMETNDKDSILATIQDDRFTMESWYSCGKSALPKIMSILNILIRLKLEDALVTLSKPLRVFERHGNKDLLQLILSYKYQNPENIIEIEEATLRLYKKVHDESGFEDFRFILMLAKNPVFPAKRDFQVHLDGWYYVLWTLIRGCKHDDLRFILVYWRQFRERIKISLNQARSLLEEVRKFFHPEMIFTFSLNADMYSLLMKNELLNSYELYVAPESFSQCMYESADFQTYLTGLADEFALSWDKSKPHFLDIIKFTCFCYNNDDLPLIEYADYAIETENKVILKHFTRYEIPKILTAQQYSRIYTRCQKHNHPLNGYFALNKSVYELHELRYNFVPVPLVLMELFTENLYILNDYVIRDVLSCHKVAGSFEFLVRLRRGCELRDDLLKFLAGFPACIQRHFRRTPSLIKNADELYFIMKATFGQYGLHKYARPFYWAVKEELLEEVLELALADKLEPAVMEATGTLKQRRFMRLRSQES